jgi:hypothetical protein
MALKQFYDLYDEENLELLKQSKDKRNALAQTVKDTINANAQDTIQQIESAGEASIKDAEHAYDDVINIANVQRLVDERAVSEAMANMGMTDSGLNRTQQTAVQLSASRKIAEAQIARQKQIDALALQIRQNILDVEKQRSADLAEAETSRQADIMGIEDTYNTNRNKFATDMYEQTQKAEQERNKALSDTIAIIEDSQKTDAEKISAIQLFERTYGKDGVLDKYIAVPDKTPASINSWVPEGESAKSNWFKNEEQPTEYALSSPEYAQAYVKMLSASPTDAIKKFDEDAKKIFAKYDDEQSKIHIKNKVKREYETGKLTYWEGEYLLQKYGITE